MPPVNTLLSEHVRTSYFWESPIDAGICLAISVPLACCYSRHRGIRIVLSAARVGLIALLCLTKSRGPVLACFAGLIFLVVYALIRRRKDQAMVALLSIGILAFLTAFAGTGNRFAAAANFADGSTQNRFAVLRGGLALLLQRPSSGLGFDRAGYVFSEWLQGPGGKYVYSNLLNSYLEIGVSCGLWALIGVYAAAVSPIMVSLAALQEGEGAWNESICPCLVASLCVFFISSLWTVSYGKISIIIMVAIISSLLFLILLHHRRWVVREAFRIASRSLLVAFLLGICTIILAKYLVGKSPLLEVTPRYVRVTNYVSDPSAKDLGVILIDARVCGVLYGENVLRLAARIGPCKEYIVPDVRSAQNVEDLFQSADVIIAFGDSGLLLNSRAAANLKEKKVVFFHPTFEPETEIYGPVDVYLPSRGASGVRVVWEWWLSAGENRKIINSGYTFEPLGAF